MKLRPPFLQPTSIPWAIETKDLHRTSDFEVALVWRRSQRERNNIAVRKWKIGYSARREDCTLVKFRQEDQLIMILWWMKTPVHAYISLQAS